MAIFKHKTTSDGKFRFKESRFSFDGNFETNEPELVDFLSNNEFWERLDKEAKEAPKVVIEEAEEAPKKKKKTK